MATKQKDDPTLLQGIGRSLKNQARANATLADLPNLSKDQRKAVRKSEFAARAKTRAVLDFFSGLCHVDGDDEQDTREAPAVITPTK